MNEVGVPLSQCSKFGLVHLLLSALKGLRSVDSIATARWELQTLTNEMQRRGMSTQFINAWAQQ